MSRLRFVTWNINSLRLRLPLLQRLVDETKADVIALQEIKCQNELVPVQALMDMGYAYQAYAGMKSYNGVAILSKLPLHRQNIYTRVDKDDCRHVEAVLDHPSGPIIVHNLYIPAGGDIPDRAVNDKFAHKLDFVAEMADWFAKNHTEKERIVALGDFNIAPFEHDVWSHKQLLDVVSHTPIEVEHLKKMQQSLSWNDVARHFVDPSEKLYSWWSYRNQDWRKSNRGRRLDHIWVTPPLTPALKRFEIMTDVRDWTQPSDHVPVVLDLEL